MLSCSKEHVRVHGWYAAARKLGLLQHYNNVHALSGPRPAWHSAASMPVTVHMCKPLPLLLIQRDLKVLSALVSPAICMKRAAGGVGGAS